MKKVEKPNGLNEFYTTAIDLPLGQAFMGFKLIRDTFHDIIPSAYVFLIKFDAHLTLHLPWLFNTNPRIDWKNRATIVNVK